MDRSKLVLEPPASLLCKLGSVAVHVKELLDPAGHHFDRVALTGLLEDPEVLEWLREADRLALLPKPRDSR